MRLLHAATAMTTIDLVYFNAGGGHRAAAQALRDVIAQQQRPWQVRLVNLVEVLDRKDSFRRLTGMAPEDLYNKRLAHGWTLGLTQELKLLQGMIRLAHPTLLRLLQQHWLQTEPDIVVSLVPNFNRVLFESLASALPGVPYVTVLTDLADHPPNFWVESGQLQDFVCGTQRAWQQARDAGHVEERVHLSSGMILRPDFYRPRRADREAERERLGLKGPVGLVLFGGQGSSVMRQIERLLPDTPLILMCGHNQALAAMLRKRKASAPRVVVEFTSDVAGWMQLADFFVGKPGPGSLSEALQQGLPVIVVRNAWTMPQERYNTDWVQEQGVGLVLKRYRDIDTGVANLLTRWPEFRMRVARQDNRAVFELPDILARVLARSAERLSPGATAATPS
jgi:UDP-N-acetylglucosamine:LPS N-acetylglucosamine transferase